jgi:hypothetical protein
VSQIAYSSVHVFAFPRTIDLRPTLLQLSDRVGTNRKGIRVWSLEKVELLGATILNEEFFKFKIKFDLDAF